MTVDELITACENAIASHAGLSWLPRVVLVSPDHRTPFPRKGWPKPVLLCTNRADGKSVWSYRADRLLEKAHELKAKLQSADLDGKV